MKDPVKRLKQTIAVAAPSDDPAASEEDSMTLLHKTKGLSEFSTLADLGLTREDLKAENFTLQSMAERGLLRYAQPNK